MRSRAAATFFARMEIKYVWNQWRQGQIQPETQAEDSSAGAAAHNVWRATQASGPDGPELPE
jgi:hypothetical protein